MSFPEEQESVARDGETKKREANHCRVRAVGAWMVLAHSRWFALGKREEKEANKQNLYYRTREESDYDYSNWQVFQAAEGAV